MSKKFSLGVNPETDIIFFDLFLKENGRVIDKITTNPRMLVEGFEDTIKHLSYKLGKEKGLKQAWRFWAIVYAGASGVLYFKNKAKKEEIAMLKEENEWLESQIENPTDI
jgi:hypothetical protein